MLLIVFLGPFLIWVFFSVPGQRMAKAKKERVASGLKTIATQDLQEKLKAKGCAACCGKARAHLEGIYKHKTSVVS